ncbi:MAG TPA: PEP/pyruvate-binding domain-containing protein [Pseudonocardia sp.]|nr:PEP/pyruvate-binding domain-containing protein [Pseudonocardia sp.]
MQYVEYFSDIGHDDINLAGGKGANLGELARAGLPVPPGFVLTTAAYRAFVTENGLDERVVEIARLPAAAGPGEYEAAAERIRTLFSSASIPRELAVELADAYTALGEPPVAVRSSATAEDLEGASFAGQQDTYLNIRAGELSTAVRDCWASLWTARALTYRARQGIDPATVSLAVVVQEMVEADAAGVVFTANPTTGRREESVIAAAWGLGESVVGGLVDTDDMVVRKGDWQVLSRTTAAKSVQTVYAAHGTEERPVPTSQRTQPVLSDAAAAELTALGARIEAHYGTPQDIEWARRGERFYVVQARPITALPEPTGPTPTDWTVPDPKAFYARASIVEQLPDPLTPLFEDLIDGSVTRSLQALFGELLGADVVGPDDVGLPTINGYAYYRYARGAMSRMMWNAPAAMKLLVKPGEHGAQARWRDRSHPRYVAVLDKWRPAELAELSDERLLVGVTELLDAGTEYYTAVQTIIPLAATSEVTFTRFYERAVRRPGDPPAQAFLLGFDSLPIRAEKSLYALARWTRERPELSAALQAAPSADVAGLLHDDKPLTDVDSAVWQRWRSQFQQHLDLYGHTVYNLDFANAVPADDPAPLIDTLRFYLRGEGTDPNQRQAASAKRREQATAAVTARLDPARRAVFTRLLRWAQGMAPVREDALGDIGLAWPQMRRMLLELGRRLVTTDVIDRTEDVFWLHRDELLAAPTGRTAAVAARKEEWRGRRRATPPQLLPDRAWYRMFENMMPAVSHEQTGNVLTGIGASAGRVTAPARVLGGPADFGRMRSGDVLVASITTPAWTPLFAMASAVVTDIGGPLSHSSIVAREYGIPAVLGTGVATRRITDGSQITVDGDTGSVTLPGTAEPDTGTPAAAEESDRARRARAIATAAAAAAVAAVVWRARRQRP